MQKCSEMLRVHAVDIAQSAAEHVDAESLERPLVCVIESLIENLAKEEAGDISPLREAGADDQLIGRLLRAAETEIIEILRQESDGREFAGCVLSLRACIRKSLPSASLNSEGVRYYQRLLGGVAYEEHPDNRRLLDFFLRILKNVRELVFVHDAAGNLLYVNDYGLDLIKYKRQDLLDGLSIYDMVVSEYIDLVEEHMTTPSAGRLSPFTIEVYAKDGERIPVEVDTRMLVTDSGQADTVVGVGRDLRLERRFQEEIRRANSYVESLLSLMPIAVLITDAHGIIREANPPAVSMCGAPSTNALINLSVYELGEDGERSPREALAHVVNSRRDYRDRVSFRTRFGKQLDCDAIAAPLESEHGDLNGLVVLLVDFSHD